MANLNGKVIKTIAKSQIQKENISNEEKNLILVFEDDTQHVINGGLSTVNKMLSSVNNQIEQLQARAESLTELQTAITEIL